MFKREAFVDYWVNGNMLTRDIATQIYAILRQPDLKHITQVCGLLVNFCFRLMIHVDPSINVGVHFFVFTLDICHWTDNCQEWIAAFTNLLINNQFFPSLVSCFFPRNNRMTSNLYFENFWPLIQGWNSYRAHQSFRKDMVHA